MSNKIVPGIYRAVIDDVVSAIKSDFEKFDVSDEILAELQHKWENKVIQSRVAEFETPQPPSTAIPPQHHPYPTHSHPHAHLYAPSGPHSYAAPPPTLPHPYTHSGVKSEPMDPRYMLNSSHQMVYSVPSLPGPQINGLSRPPAPGGQTSVLSFPPGPPQPQAPSATTAQNGVNGNTNAPGVPLGRPYIPPTSTASTSSTPPQSQSSNNSGGGGSGGRIPQLDGPSEDDDSDEDSRTPPPLPYVPRSNHPSLPQASQQSQASSSVAADEAINSDLDDSDIDDEDEEKEEGSGVDTDIVFCTYEKVTRVKNKWRSTFKDGIVHINGKDYLFAKCNGEFEW